jgi:ornithine cyclodeaminase
MPTAILDASAITEIRTAAVSAVATRLLSRDDSRVLAILGAGVQARSHLEALCLVRPFESIRLFSRTEAHARELADGAAREGDVSISVASSAADAVDGAHVVVTATSSREPVLAREWLADGVHINAVGASIPSARELDVATVAASALFADSRESLSHEAGEFILATEEGAISGIDHVRGELGEVLTGKAPGRQGENEITLFRSLGLAVEDLAAAEHAVKSARARGLGTEVEL